MFKRLIKHYFPVKNEKSDRFRKEMAAKLDKRAIKYCTERQPDQSEAVIGKNGMINLRDRELILLSSEQIVFRCKICELSASELMSLDGVILTGPDLEHGAVERTVIAYYTDFYKMVTKD